MPGKARKCSLFGAHWAQIIMKSNLSEFRSLVGDLDQLFWWTGRRLTAKKPKGVFMGLLLNFTVPMTLCADFLFVYMIFFQSSERFIVVQQMWAFIAVFQIFIRAVRRMVYWDEMETLLNWFDDLFAREYSPEYLEIVNKHQERMVYLIRLGIRSVFSSNYK